MIPARQLLSPLVSKGPLLAPALLTLARVLTPLAHVPWEPTLKALTPPSGAPPSASMPLTRAQMLSLFRSRVTLVPAFRRCSRQALARPHQLNLQCQVMARRRWPPRARRSRFHRLSSRGSMPLTLLTTLLPIPLTLLTSCQLHHAARLLLPRLAWLHTLRSLALALTAACWHSQPVTAPVSVSSALL